MSSLRCCTRVVADLADAQPKALSKTPSFSTVSLFYTTSHRRKMYPSGAMYKASVSPAVDGRHPAMTGNRRIHFCIICTERIQISA